MSAPHPTRIVRFHLLAVLLGVSIPFAIENLIHEYSTPMLLAEAAFLLTALNFFHGKVVTLEDEDYNNALIDRPILALVDYGLNLLVILCFVFMAFFLDKPGKLVVANLALRTLDTILVFAVRTALPRDDIRKAQNTWLSINIGAIVSFLALTLICWPLSEHHWATSWTFLGITLADILIDYRVNRKIYFSMADSWNEMARFWNEVQGERGDIYRQAVIIPVLLEIAKLDNSKSVLDAGCGNGCISRALAETGAKVTGVDNSERHLEMARSYGGGISYQLVDLNQGYGPIEGQPFDVAVFCFTLQDCESIKTPLYRIGQNMKPGGLVIVIFENDSSFANTEAHSTTRRWLSSPRHAGEGRRQLIVWEPRLIRLLRVPDSNADVHDTDSEWDRDFKTVTRQWSVARYKEAAAKCGLALVPSEKQLTVDKDFPAEKNQAFLLNNYSRQPRFSMLVFEKKPAGEPDRTAAGAPPVVGSAPVEGSAPIGRPAPAGESAPVEESSNGQ
jgi:SAM-dependent methyltransferase